MRASADARLAVTTFAMSVGSSAERDLPNHAPSVGWAGADRKPAEWLDAAWHALGEQRRLILTRRLAGDTLETIARHLGVSRERVRQVQKSAGDALLVAQRRDAPDLPEQLETELRDDAAVSDERITMIAPARADAARDVLLIRLGLNRPVTWPDPCRATGPAMRIPSTISCASWRISRR